MPTSQAEAIIEKLQKGRSRTLHILGALSPEQWAVTVYPGPPRWDARALLVHLLSAEEYFLAICREVAVGGQGVPVGFDYDTYNAREQERLQGWSPQALLLALDEARRATLAWVRDLDDDDLDRMGRHPVLGEVTLQVMITAIYGHALVHMRDLQAALTR
jgi:uncharacterized protein (TIGR03083 family)